MGRKPSVIGPSGGSRQGRRKMRNIMQKPATKGVTLIELLIVVIILATLSVIAIPRISQSSTETRIKACQTNITILNSAIERYKINTGSYPGALKDLTEDLAYFPDGVPRCPLTTGKYPNNLVNNRIHVPSHSH